MNSRDFSWIWRSLTSILYSTYFRFDEKMPFLHLKIFVWIHEIFIGFLKITYVQIVLCHPFYNAPLRFDKKMLFSFLNIFISWLWRSFMSVVHFILRHLFSFWRITTFCSKRRIFLFVLTSSNNVKHSSSSRCKTCFVMSEIFNWKAHNLS